MKNLLLTPDVPKAWLFQLQRTKSAWSHLQPTSGFFSTENLNSPLLMHIRIAICWITPLQTYLPVWEKYLQQMR